MARWSLVRNGANLATSGAGNIDVLGARNGNGGWVRGSVFREGFMGDGDGCIERRRNGTSTRRGKLGGKFTDWSDMRTGSHSRDRFGGCN